MLGRTLYAARWVLPATSSPIRDGALLVAASGRIEQVGTLKSFEALTDVHRVDFGDAALLPGLVNAHAHPELAAFRGLLDDLPFHYWIPELMRCKREADLDSADF